jgi:hypothetical protein
VIHRDQANSSSRDSLEYYSTRHETKKNRTDLKKNSRGSGLYSLHAEADGEGQEKTLSLDPVSGSRLRSSRNGVRNRQTRTGAGLGNEFGRENPRSASKTSVGAENWEGCFAAAGEHPSRNQIPCALGASKERKLSHLSSRTKIDRETDCNKKNKAAAANNEWRKPTQEKETLHEPNQPQSKS